MSKYMDKYKSILMDCDGVILDSNNIKSEVFYDISIPFGEEKAEKLVFLNKEYGGMSRFKKIEMFVNTILKIDNKLLIKKLVKDFGDKCLGKLIKCNLTPNLIQFLDKFKDRNIFVISGGLEKELEEVFEKKGLKKYFTEILGCPLSKKEIIQDLLRKNMLADSCVFIGDSKIDFEASLSLNSDFIFMKEFTEFNNWYSFFKDKKIKIINNLGFLI